MIKYILILLILITLTIICVNKKLLIYDYFTNQEIESVKWPFMNLQDENNKNLNIMALMAYFDGDKHKKEFQKHLDNGIKFIGLSANQSFPRLCDNPYGQCHVLKNIQYNNKNVEEYVYGWCHCFRKPEEYIKNNIPTVLISESDFIDTNGIVPKNLTKKYDFITIQPKDNKECKDGWKSYYKNWSLCKKLLKILVDEMNLKGVVIGRKGCDTGVNKINNLVLTDDVSHSKLKKYMEESKFTLLPNLEEASPRVLVESLCLNVPVLVYENILGGWKYINNDTGEFFNEDNFKSKVNKILNTKYNPRTYYVNNYGIEKSGLRLKEFIKKIIPSVRDTKYIQFSKSW